MYKSKIGVVSALPRGPQNTEAYWTHGKLFQSTCLHTAAKVAAVKATVDKAS